MAQIIELGPLAAPMRLETKTPTEEKIYGIDWTTKLGSATITSSTWQVPAGMTGISDDYDSHITLIKTGGGTLGVDYTWVNIIITSAGERLEAALIIEVRAAT